MRVYEPFEFECPACGTRLKPDGSLGLFYCPDCRKIYDAGQNRHLAKEAKYYINTLRKSAPDVFTVAAFSYYESVSKTEQREAAYGVWNGANIESNDGYRAVNVTKQDGFLNELLRRGEEYERLRTRALDLINSLPPEVKRGGSPLAKDYESYTSELNVPADLREAVELSEEMYCRGASYYNERNYGEAVKNLTTSANMGHVKANYLLAMCYVGGKGVSKDVLRAIDYMRKAAEQGDQDAQFELGMLYGNAKLGVKDTRESAKWLRKAAEQGDRRAQGILGVYYLNGIGVPQSDSYAVSWVRKAAAQGFAEAQCMLGAVYADGRGVMKNIPEARTWYKKAIAQGNRLAREQLDGLERELAEARRRREEERRAQSAYGGTYNSNSYSRNNSGRQTSSYNRTTSGRTYSGNSSSGSSSGSGFNWLVFIVLLFVGGSLGAWIYLAIKGGRVGKIVGRVILVLAGMGIIIALALTCSASRVVSVGSLLLSMLI